MKVNSALASDSRIQNVTDWVPQKQILRKRLVFGTCIAAAAAAAAAKLFQLCLTLCDPIDGSLPCSPVPGILQARTLEWVSISFSNA